MTYNRAQVTCSTSIARCFPALTDADKARINTTLKEAREEAMDGGSADEKAAIFQKHKDVLLDAYLKSQGHDVLKATPEWEAKQKTEAASAPAPAKNYRTVHYAGAPCRGMDRRARSAIHREVVVAGFNCKHRTVTFLT